MFSMWEFIARIILRNRILILVVLALITAFMAYHGSQVKLSYKFGGILPKSDSTYIAYLDFIDQFSEDGNVVVLGIEGGEIYQYDKYKAWYDLGDKLKAIDGIDSIFSIGHLYTLRKNETEKHLDFDLLFETPPKNQKDVDVIKTEIENLPFYRNLLYNDSTNATVMMVFVDADKFNSEKRGDVIKLLKREVKGFEISQDLHVAVSGLPYIRTVTSEKVKDELGMFVFIAALVTALILFIFFRSLRIVFFSLTVVLIGVVWSVGTISLLDFRLSLLMALIPPLVIVIGVPNCVFLLNKYHQEYVHHGNRVKALVRTIAKIGNATFMTNTTTALGFSTFIFTSSPLLKEFGAVASLSILGIFLLALFIIPIIFSYLEPPKARHTKHLEKRWLDFTINAFVRWVTYDRKWVYIITVIVLVLGFFGIYQIKTTGHIVDDLPETDQVMVDLHFFEHHFNGVMPFEIIIDSRKKGLATKDKTIKKIDKLQKLLAEYPEFSKSFSIADAVKFAKQAFYNGNPAKYKLISSNEKGFIAPYIEGEDAGIAKLFLDSTQRITRVNTQIADVGTMNMEALLYDLEPRVKEIFPPDKFDVTYTGTSIVFLKGADYLVKNLFISLYLAIIAIAIIMAMLFNSFRMVLISLIPNLIPLICTAAIMGYFGVPLKPSTILVFSIVSTLR